jgi:hypothetical protein
MGPLLRSAVVALGLSASVLSACGEPFEPAAAGAGGASATTTTVTASTSTSGGGGAGHGGAPAGGHAPGGGGGAPACLGSGDCPPPPDCSAVECIDGACVESPLPSDTPLPPASQVLGDCRERRCDGAGEVVDAPDDGDLPAQQANPCFMPSCSGGVPLQSPVEAGTPCSNTLECDGQGACVECYVGGPTCDGEEKCDAGKCVPPACKNGVKDPAETGIDCGGACSPCADGQPCLVPADCASRFCSAGTCAACTQNADCTGDEFCADTKACTPKKALGVACGSDPECEKGACADGVCCDAKCDGPCHECASKPGTCQNVLDGLEDPACPATKQATCGTTGKCLGGACAKYPKGAFCSVDCVSGTQKKTNCDGAGACVEPGATITCAPYVCAGTVCATSCSTDAGCVPSRYCDQSGVCLPKKAKGSVCATTPECQVGLSCTGGFCCTEAACGAGATCATGSCACKPGFLDCDGQLGCEISDAATNEDHCGACGNACVGARFQCFASACRDLCNPPPCKAFLNCNGSEQCYGGQCGVACGS